MSFSLSPATQTVAINTPATVTISNTPQSGAQVFWVVDGGGGGTLTPFNPSIAPDAGTTTFTYQNATPGVYTLTVTQALSGAPPGKTVQITVVGGSPPSPTGFTLTPASNAAPVNTPTAAYILELVNGGSAAVAGGGGQAFTLASSDGGGIFAPGTTVTIPAGQSSVSFTYQSPNAGIATLTATASGAPYIVNTATAQAVISLPGVGSIGGRSMGPLITANGMEFGEAYLRGTLTTADDTPFAKLQSLDFKIATGLKEAMGPEQYSAVAVGIGDRKYTGDLTVETYSLQRFQLLFGGSAPATIAGIVAPAAGPTLTPGAGSTAFTAGNIAVAYSYRNKYGVTVVSPLTNAVVTSGQQIAVTAITPLPAGVTSVDWYVSSQSYSSSALAAAAPLYFLVNNVGGAFTIVAYGATTAATVPAASQIVAGGASFTHYAYDEPALGGFTIHCINPADGSGRNLLIYGCVCTDLANSLKLREWTTEKITFNAYGDNTTVPAKIFEWYAPATFKV